MYTFPMVIERVSFEGGYLVDQASTADNVWKEVRHRHVALGAGEYDLTPEKLRDKISDIRLIVNPAGFGQINDGNERPFYLSHNEPAYVLRGPELSNGDYYLYEIIVYKPGSSAVKRRRLLR